MSVDLRDPTNLVFCPDYDAKEDEYGDERGDFDGHELNRMKLLAPMQYERRDEDEALIRYVVEQEIIAREQGVLEGIGETLELGAFLLARFRRPSDVSLFIRAKTMNFDAGCGFDSEYVYWVLQDEPWASVEIAHPELARRWAKFGYQAPDSLDAWWAGREAYFVDSLDDESG